MEKIGKAFSSTINIPQSVGMLISNQNLSIKAGPQKTSCPHTCRSFSVLKLRVLKLHFIKTALLSNKSLIQASLANHWNHSAAWNYDSISYGLTGIKKEVEKLWSTEHCDDT